jgi:hypothetical protein
MAPGITMLLHVLREHPEEVELALTIYHSRHSLERLERVKRSESDWALLWLSVLKRPSFTKLQYLKVDLGGDIQDIGDTGDIELKDIVHVCIVLLVTHIYKVSILSCEHTLTSYTHLGHAPTVAQVVEYTKINGQACGRPMANNTSSIKGFLLRA